MQVYVPAHFRQDEIGALHEAMRRFPFATLVAHGEDGFQASHVPMLLDPDPVPYGTLHFHVARANAQWRFADGAREMLAIFLGPDAYVSPSILASKRETGKVVPTWNYVAVHAHGSPVAYDDPIRLRALVERLTAAHENERPLPWAVDDAPADYIATQLRAIVGLEMPIRRLLGKWKLSQNRPPADIASAVAALAVESPAAQAVANMMEAEAQA